MMKRGLLVMLAATSALVGCGGDGQTPVTVFVAAAEQPALAAFAAETPYPVRVELSADPYTDVANARGSGLRVGIVSDLGCGECYRLERVGSGVLVHAGGVLGAQYGLAATLEGAGFRFFTPTRPYLPARLADPALAPGFAAEHRARMGLRGLHLHTLHTIEGFYDFWVPGAEHLAGARRVVDWVVKNRGNYLQWVALDDIQDADEPAVAAAWREHTRAIIDYAHLRGLKVGLGIQLFGASNLQQAFDLVDRADEANAEPAIRARLQVLAGLGLDRINLSFGEFFGADPDAFVAAVNLAHGIILEVLPGVEVSAVIHVGKTQEVMYRGETLLYYFLVKFADMRIVPWIHTVMFYDLFEDAGGAYHHDDFHEHREFLLGRLAAGQRVAYFPESAYWIAFDNSVPLYLPLYVRSRWHDQAEIARRAREGGFADLGEHVLFSSGWEWGYWQHDYSVLRENFELPDHWGAELEAMYAPFGAAGARLAATIIAVGELQHDYLMIKRLMPWLAARDAVIDIGDEAGILSQPDRPSYADLAALPPAERAAFRAAVVEPLAEFATGLRAQLGAARAAGMPDGPWRREVIDGIDVDQARAEFAESLLRAVLAGADGQSPTAWLARADAAMERGRAAMLRRHGDRHDMRPELVDRNSNATLYQYGYLYEADLLCYWDRERVLARNQLLGETTVVPGCVLSF